MDQDRIKQFNEEKQRLTERSQDHKVIEQAADKIDRSVKHQTAKATAERRNTTFKVKSVEPLATPTDIQNVVKTLEKLSKDLRPKEFKPVLEQLQKVVIELGKLPREYPEFPEFPEFPDFPKTTKVENLKEIQPWLKAVVDAVGKLEVKPEVNVKQPDVNVTQAKIDITPITKALERVEKSLTEIEIPQTDLTTLVDATRKTTKAINSLSFPVPNFLLPFKDVDGKATQITLDPTGNLATTNYDCLIKADSGDSNITYIGKAPAGTLTAVAAWQIKEVDTTSGTEVRYADGDTNFDNEWDERESLSY